jgi:hypothetical protein
VRTVFALLVTGLVAIAGCAEDDKEPIAPPEGTDVTTWNESEGHWETVLDATSYDRFTYFNFATLETVSVTDSEARTSTEWHVAFQRFNVKTNSGGSGPLGIEGVDLHAIGYANPTDFDGITDDSMVGDEDWQQDEVDLAVDEWYVYNPVSHQLTVTGYVYAMKDAQERYAKIQVISMVGGGMPPDMGTISVRYFLQPDGTANLDDPGDTLTFDGSGGGPIYVDLSGGTTIDVADPFSSASWDLAFENYEIHLNCPLWGAGSAAAYPAFYDMTDSTDFEALTEAPVLPPYFQDQASSALTDWYEYDQQTHVLSSRDYVYLLRVSGALYKVQIQSYYREVQGSPQSGWITFRWLEL